MYFPICYQLQLHSFVLLCCVICSVKAYNVVIESPSTTLIGSYANFTATLYDDGQVAKQFSYKYIWTDNAKPSHSVEILSREPHSSWSIEYPFNKTTLGIYKVTLEVERYFVFWMPIATRSVFVNVTNKLGGDLMLIQGNVQRSGPYVSTKAVVNHTIALPAEEYKYLKQNATYIQTYWYRNCTYMGVSNELSYEAVYNQTNTTYIIEALAVASFEKVPVPTTTTPMPTSTSTVMPTTAPSPLNSTITTNSPTTSSEKASVSVTTMPSITTTVASGKVKRDIASVSKSTANGTASLINQKQEIKEKDASLSSKKSVNESTAVINPKLHPGFITAQQQELINSVSSHLMVPPPFNCDSKQLTDNGTSPAYYGYYKRIIVPKDPISNFTFSKQTWLQHGDILNMHVQCDGSPSIEYCTLVFNAPYNATGKEVCPYYSKLKECKFNYTRYFSESKAVLFFIRNEVSKLVNQVTINIYEVKKQSQLSVVVVPVTFTLIAIILVVFGVSYYVQKRTRFNVEVADFNFGETQSVDMEYKTFTQRLYESICEAAPSRWRFCQSTADIGSDYENSGGGGGIGVNASNSNVQYNMMN